jgi:hypothetical protein
LYPGRIAIFDSELAISLQGLEEYRVLWANVNTPTNFLLVWNNVARTVSIAREISTVERARLFALTNISLHDALQTTFASKFQHGVWRPIRSSQFGRIYLASADR